MSTTITHSKAKGKQAITSGNVPNNPDHLGSPALMDRTNKTTKESSSNEGQASIGDGNLTPLPESFGGRQLSEELLDAEAQHNC